MIGSFGGAVFSVSDRTVYTLNNLSRSIAPRLATHDLLGRKPKTEWVGEGLESVTFTIMLHVSFGVRVRAELDRWAAMADSGTVSYLMIGTSPIGQNRWIVASISEAYEIIASRGEILSANVDVTLQEYT